MRVLAAVLLLTGSLGVGYAHAEPGGPDDYSAPAPLFGDAGPGGSINSRSYGDTRSWEEMNRDAIRQHGREYRAEQDRLSKSQEPRQAWKEQYTITQGGKTTLCVPQLNGSVVCM